jgi:uncharacterized lipoprotein YajG
MKNLVRKIMRKNKFLFVIFAVILLSGCAFPHPNGFLLDRLSARQNPNPMCVNVFVNSTVCSDSALNGCVSDTGNNGMPSKIRQTVRQKITNRKKINFDIPENKLLKEKLIRRMHSSV